MKLTCLMIVAVLLLTAWIYATPVDSRNAFKDASLKARDRKNLKKRDECLPGGKLCTDPDTPACCSGICFIVCT
uniref:Ctr_15_T conopeptide n=1 Tax=Conus tribblei TaxID=101761 RepID=A0A0C9SFL5_CONTD